MPSVNNLAHCQESCLEKSSCGAYLFERSSKTCSHVDGEVDKKKLKKKLGVIYILDRDCSEMNMVVEKNNLENTLPLSFIIFHGDS